MNVRDIMSPAVLTLTEDQRLYHALQVMEEHRVRHVLVIDEDGLRGIVSDRDIKRQINAAFDTGSESENDRLAMLKPLHEIMTRNVITSGPDDDVQTVAEKMLHHRISAVPVVEDDAILGIVTTSDILELFLRLSKNET